LEKRLFKSQLAPGIGVTDAAAASAAAASAAAASAAAASLPLRLSPSPALKRPRYPFTAR